jgi:hypothetical protein
LSIISTNSARREKSSAEEEGNARLLEDEVSGFSGGEIGEDGMDVGGKMTRHQYIG